MHFRLVEFACRDGSDLVLIHPALVDMLERLRITFDRPVHLNSGFRTITHNMRIGGKRCSWHLYGMAADITVRGLLPEQVAAEAQKLDPGGLGLYPSFVHIDVAGEGRRWGGILPQNR